MKKNPKRGGFREGAGRKPVGDKALDSALIVKCLADDKARWLAAADAKGVTLADVIRAHLNRWSRH
jgi:hypothetical protein